MQRWRKLGRVFNVVSNGSWMMTHAAVPTTEQIDAKTFRVYFGTRDEKSRASIGWFELNLSGSCSVGRVGQDRVLGPGELGTFDDSGVLPSWITQIDGKRFLYYIGWNLGVTVPFRNFTGLAISEKGSSDFHRLSRAPLLTLDKHDPFFYCNPCVLRVGDHWKMWYLSTVRWESTPSGPRHYYHLKQDVSSDGVHWQRRPSVAIDFKNDLEYAISRPTVVKDPDGYKMWFSHRAADGLDRYRLGFAESEDGEIWKRRDEAVSLDVSAEGWDSETVAYPCVFDADGSRYMLYNGNGYGKTGIGLAVLEQD